MTKKTFRFTLYLAVVVGLFWAVTVQAQPLTVIVHPSVEMDDISFSELKGILFGDRQFWSAGHPITIFLPAPDTWKRHLLYATVYQMKHARFRQYWIAKVFRAEIPSVPKTALSDEMAVGLTARLPGTLSFVGTVSSHDGIKVLKINGRLPNEAGYPLIGR